MVKKKFTPLPEGRHIIIEGRNRSAHPDECVYCGCPKDYERKPR